MMYEMEQVGKIHLTGVDIDRWENVTSIVVWLFMSSDVDVSSLVNIQVLLLGSPKSERNKTKEIKC